VQGLDSPYIVLVVKGAKCRDGDLGDCLFVCLEFNTYPNTLSTSVVQLVKTSSVMRVAMSSSPESRLK